MKMNQILSSLISWNNLVVSPSILKSVIKNALNSSKLSKLNSMNTIPIKLRSDYLCQLYSSKKPSRMFARFTESSSLVKVTAYSSVKVVPAVTLSQDSLHTSQNTNSGRLKFPETTVSKNSETTLKSGLKRQASKERYTLYSANITFLISSNHFSFNKRAEYSYSVTTRSSTKVSLKT
jgi:hypothetical protein